jgi:hypothetical protein
MVDEILISIATALAAKAATSVVDVVKKAIHRRPKADQAVLAEVLDAPTALASDSPVVPRLAEVLARAEADDAEFKQALRAEWAKVDHLDQHADNGGVVNQVTGNVTGRVIQARDIHGGIHF